MARPMQVRIDFPKALKEAISILESAEKDDAGDADSIRGTLPILRQFAEHAEQVRKGEHTPAQLCALYQLEGPPRPPKAKAVSVPPAAETPTKPAPAPTPEKT